MPFKPGVSGNPKGKAVGTRNKFKFEVTEILKNFKYIDPETGKQVVGFDPFYQLAKLAINAKSEKVKCEACSELATYVAPKLKHIEHSADSEAPFTISINMTK